MGIFDVPKKYPPLHPATAIDIATAALPGPNIPPTTVGSVVKKEPFAAPLRVAKIASGPIVLETGQIANIPDPTSVKSVIVKRMENVLSNVYSGNGKSTHLLCTW